MVFFVISGNMVFLFSGKFDIFSLDGKWNKMIFIKKYMETWYFLYICINVKNLALPFCQKKNVPSSLKNTLKADISGIAEKDNIHRRKCGISVEISYWSTS